MADFVDVTYRGLEVVRKARFQPEADGGFVELAAPLPVGATVTLLPETGEPRDARVVSVVEQEAGAKSPPGMRLRWRAEEAAPAAPAAADATASTEPEGESGKKGKRGRKRGR